VIGVYLTVWQRGGDNIEVVYLTVKFTLTKLMLQRRDVSIAVYENIQSGKNEL